MAEPAPHRKTVQHFNVGGHAHLLTFSCYQRMPLLNDDVWKRKLSWFISRATERHRWRLVSFVYMPEHVHLLAFPDSPAAQVESLLYAIKKPFSSDIKRMLVHERNPLVETLTVQERPGKFCFRLWQEGPGHDRNLISVENCVRTAEYMHNNPVRRGLCDSPDQWRWSSWAQYHCQETTPDAALPRIDGFPP